MQYLGLDGDNSSVGFEVIDLILVFIFIFFENSFKFGIKDFDFENFQDLKINLIMTDYSMPGMTGYELLKKIKVSFVDLFLMI